MRRARRYRKTPCRRPRPNRSRGGLPPSTKSRRGWNLRLARFLATLYPITAFIVEDVVAETRKGQHRRNVSFSPLGIGKAWFCRELSQIAPVARLPGYETKRLRNALGLRKSSRKREETVWAHCVDSWVLGPLLEAVRLTTRGSSGWIRSGSGAGPCTCTCASPPEAGRAGGAAERSAQDSDGAYRPSIRASDSATWAGHMGRRLSPHAVQNGRRAYATRLPRGHRVLAPCSWRVWIPDERRASGAPPPA
jgi:hypothetical protein